MGFITYRIFMAAADFYVGLIIVYILMSWLPSMPVSYTHLTRPTILRG